MCTVSALNKFFHFVVMRMLLVKIECERMRSIDRRIIIGVLADCSSPFLCGSSLPTRYCNTVFMFQFILSSLVGSFANPSFSDVQAMEQ